MQDRGWFFGIVLIVVIASGLLLRAALQPCAWLDLALRRSGCLCTLQEDEGAVESVDFSPAGDLVAVASNEGAVQVWQVANRTLLRTFKVPVATGVAHTYKVAFSPDGTAFGLKQSAVFGTPDGAIYVWRVADGERLPTLEGHTGRITSLAFSPDGQILASGSWDKTIRLWQMKDAKLQQLLEGHQHEVLSVAFSPDGKTLASGSFAGVVKLWHVAEGTPLRNLMLSDFRSPIASLAFSPDGTTLAAGTWTDQVQLWDVAAGTLAHRLQSPHWGGIHSLTFSPSGKILALGTSGYTVQWWDVGERVLLDEVAAHTDSVKSVAFSPDGETMASGSLDGTVRLWQVP